MFLALCMRMSVFCVYWSISIRKLSLLYETIICTIMNKTLFDAKSETSTKRNRKLKRLHWESILNDGCTSTRGMRRAIRYDTTYMICNTHFRREKSLSDFVCLMLLVLFPLLLLLLFCSLYFSCFHTHFPQFLHRECNCANMEYVCTLYFYCLFLSHLESLMLCWALYCLCLPSTLHFTRCLSLYLSLIGFFILHSIHVVSMSSKLTLSLSDSTDVFSIFIPFACASPSNRSNTINCLSSIITLTIVVSRNYNQF